MAETHELRLKINAAAAKSGSREFVAAIKSIKTAVRGLEKDSTGAFLKLKKNLKDITGTGGKLRLGVDRQSMRDLDSMAKKQEKLAKHLSTTATKGRDVNKVMGLLSRSYSRADTATGKFSKSVNSTNSSLLRQIQLVTKLRSELSSLKGFSAKVNVNGTAGGSAGMARTAAAHAAGSAAARAGSHQVGRGSAAWQVEREMRSIAGAANAKEAAIRRATGGMRGLENAFSSTYQVGSAFRVMLGAITFGSFISNVYQAGDALDQFRVSMEVATGSTAAAMRELDYVDEMAMRLGTNLQSVRDNYAKFSISADIAGVSAGQTRKIFESVSVAMSVLGKSTADQNLAFLALEQMMSKGKVSSEELRRQLGERLPGAVSMMAEALGVGVDQLQDMLKAGEINSADALPRFADVLMKRFAPGVEKASRRAGNNLQKLQTQITKFFEAVASSGVMDELAYQFRRLTDTLKSGEGAEAARKLGEALTKMTSVGGEALLWMIENVDKLGSVIKALAVGGLVSRVALMAQAFTTAGTQLAGYIAVMAKARTARKADIATTTAMTAATNANTKATIANAASMAAGTGRMAKFAAGTRTAMTVATRGLAVLGPLGAAASVALLAIPALMGETGKSATQMAVSIDAAISRSGIKFDELGEVIHKTAKMTALESIVEDLHLLEGALDKFVDRNSSSLSDLMSIGKSKGERLDEADGFFERWGTMFSGDKRPEGMTDAAVEAHLDIHALWKKLADGQATVFEMQEKVNEAFRSFPTGREVFAGWRAQVARFIKEQRALAANKDRLVESFGSDRDKAVKGIAEEASRVYRNNGTGLDDLAKNAKEVAAKYPEAAEAVQNIMNNLSKASKEPVTLFEFEEQNRGFYTQIADQLSALRKDVEITEKAFDAARKGMATPFDRVSTRLSVAATDGAVSQDQNAYIQGLLKRYQEQGTVSASLDGLDVSGMSADQREYAQAVRETFDALQPYQKTIGSLDTILREVASAHALTGGELEDVQQQLVDVAQGGDLGVVSITELLSSLEDVSHALPKDSSLAAVWAEMVAQLEAAARASEEAGNAANTARGEYASSTQGIAVMGDEADVARQKILGMVAALNSIGGVSGGINDVAAAFVEKMEMETKLQAMPVYERKAFEAHTAEVKRLNEEYSKVVSSADDHLTKLEARKALEWGIANANAKQAEMIAAAKAQWSGTKWEDPLKKRGGGSGRDKTDAEKYKDLMKSIVEDTDDLEVAHDKFKLLAEGQYETAEAAEMMAKAMAYSGGAVGNTTRQLIAQAEAAALLKEQMEKVANDPVKDWIKASKDWTTASQEIKMTAIGGLSDALTDFVLTGEMNFNKLAKSVIAALTRVLVNRAVADFIDMMGAGFGGNILTGIAGAVFGAGSEGGYSESLPGRSYAPISAFRNAPQYAEGTANTSNGIPSILHPNEAVVPLSRGRKIPVDLGGTAHNGGGNLIMGDINVSVDGGGSGDDDAMAMKIGEHIRESLEGLIDERIAEGQMYGGSMNPRGGAY